MSQGGAMMGSLWVRIFLIPHIFGIFLLSGKSWFWVAIPIIYIISFSLFNRFNPNSEGGQELQVVGELIIAFAGSIGLAAYFTPNAAIFWMGAFVVAFIIDYARNKKPGVY